MPASGTGNPKIQKTAAPTTETAEVKQKKPKKEKKK
jgi:hypothetical protein